MAVDVASNRESPVMPGKGVFAISDDDAPIVLASDEDGPLVLARSGQTTVLAESPAVESVCAVTGGKLVVIYESKRKLHLVQLD
ncbi:MAG TPA: hypothetical protein PK402_06130 [Tepidisphaeraceae bacterium]|nr:hypothetical protein [Tepidisphaeraceae bacterium]